MSNSSSRPAKPRPDFPLFPHQNGQWAKKIKGRPYFFGSWRQDPAGWVAVKELAERLPGILAGTDHLRRRLIKSDRVSVAELVEKYLAQRHRDVKAYSIRERRRRPANDPTRQSDTASGRGVQGEGGGSDRCPVQQRSR
jgi:hypothetical protein